MKNTIFVGNKITMEGENIEIPDCMLEHKEDIEDVVYEVFYGSFHSKVDKKFLRTMRINDTLYSFANYHVKKFIGMYESNVDKLKSNSRDIIESYFIDAVESYKNRLNEVAF